MVYIPHAAVLVASSTDENAPTRVENAENVPFFLPSALPELGIVRVTLGYLIPTHTRTPETLTRNPHGFTRQNESQNSQNNPEMSNICAK
jgi:hypothetical protein